MEQNQEKERIPLWVESPRGDDRFGTNQNTGAIISDHDAKTQGVPFQADVPKEQIQKAVEDQLKDGKWVCIEKKDGNTELLTEKDIPDDEEGEPENEGEDESKEDEKPKEDWKDAFNLNNTKPKPASTTCAATNGKKPEKPKEVWESKFENITSATATHKGKGG